MRAETQAGVTATINCHQRLISQRLLLSEPRNAGLSPQGGVEQVGRGCEEEDSNEIEEDGVSHDVEVALGPAQSQRMGGFALLRCSRPICILS